MRINKLQWGTNAQDTMPGARLKLTGWVEVLLLASVASLFSTISQHFVEWPFLSTIPLAFIALRHGSSSAVLGCLFWILLCSLVQKSLGQDPEPFAVEHLGPVLVSLLCGYFSDFWHEKQVATKKAEQHSALLLDEVTLSHHLLQLSHARLEQRVVGGVDTLRESLQRLHSSLATHAEHAQPLAERGPELLLQFDSLTWIQSASIHMVGENGQPHNEAAAEIGDPPALHNRDELVAEAITQRKMLAVTDFRATTNRKTPLAVAPIVDNDNRVRAIVCVHKVPFLSFNRENLALMAVLAAHLGHMISTTERGGSPNLKRNFAHTVQRACEDAEKFNLPSTMAQWIFHSSEMALTAAKYIRDNVRGLDHPWLENSDNATRLTVLCSLTDRSEFDSMLERLKQLLAVRYAIDLDANVSEFQVHVITAKDDKLSLLRLMKMQAND